MKIIGFLLFLLLATPCHATKYYGTFGILGGTSHFSDKTTESGETAKIEPFEAGFILGFGRRFGKKWALEFEYLFLFPFDVSSTSDSGGVGLYSFTMTPIYYIPIPSIHKKFDLALKMRFGHTKISGGKVLGHTGEERDLSLGPAIGFKLRKRRYFNWYGDVGMILPSGAVSDYRHTVLVLGFQVML